jgi:hypothetical protein
MDRLAEAKLCSEALRDVFVDNDVVFDAALLRYDSLVSYRQFPHWVSALIDASIGCSEADGAGGDPVYTCGYNSTHQITDTLMDSLKQQKWSEAYPQKGSSPWCAVVAAAMGAFESRDSFASRDEKDSFADNEGGTDGGSVSLVDVVALCTCAAWQRGSTMDLALNFDVDIDDGDDCDDDGRSDVVFNLPKFAGMVRNSEMLPDLCMPVPVVLFYMLDGVQKSCGATLSMCNTRPCLQAPVAAIGGRCIRQWEPAVAKEGSPNQSPRAARSTLCTASFNAATAQLSAHVRSNVVTLGPSIGRRAVPHRLAMIGLAETLNTVAASRQSTTEQLRLRGYFMDRFLAGGEFDEAMKFTLSRHAMQF